MSSTAVSSKPSKGYLYVGCYDTPGGRRARVIPSVPAGMSLWMGRTTSEVEEDNRKIAEKEGANAKRKVVPIGLTDDEWCWTVDTDGIYTLRMYRHIKEISGEWKAHPLYEGAWCFALEEESKA